MNLLHPPAPSTAVLATFPLLTVSVCAAIVVLVHRASLAAGHGPAIASNKRLATASLLTAWLAVTTALAASGLLARFDVLPPPLLLLVAATAVVTTTLALTGFGALLARHAPLAALVGIQAFRVPLEWMLHQLSLDGVLPIQMTWDGMNFDVASGATAVAVALWAWLGRVPRFVLAAWNLFGVVLLLVIVTIAILSSPVPFRVFWNEPANTLVTTVPFVWLPTLLVPVAWTAHLIVFRRLRMRID